MKGRKGTEKKRQRTIQKDQNPFGDKQVQDPKWLSEVDFAWWSKGKKRQVKGKHPFQRPKGAGSAKFKRQIQDPAEIGTIIQTMSVLVVLGHK